MACFVATALHPPWSLALNGKPVQDVEQVRAAMKERPKSVALLVARDGQQIFVPVRLG